MSGSGQSFLNHFASFLVKGAKECFKNVWKGVNPGVPD
ncbi:hypothetical protein B4099_1640 [Heyndrickxia coagulans]|uniref:Uncharacterized protein n=1 Tax=Heyndrickxia coagulans TaxID=1398 RepID=A0A150KIB4_HEYCO|nr:hypothetical protein B4099_1640 [Heyndrickxia coagulans]